MRTGMLLKKIGMTHLYSAEGVHQPVTVLKNEGCMVLGVKQKAVDGYDSVCIGVGKAKASRLAKPQRVFYEKAKVEPAQKMIEFRVDGDLPETGKGLSAGHFVEGQMVDASAVSIGKGFAGAMKRHHFSGLRATHGVSISHRSLGSTGHCQDPGRVFKGKKMAGHMGAKRITTQNLVIVRVDTELELVFVKGAVPGSRGSWVELKDAIKHPLPKDAPMPAGFIGEVDKKVEVATETPDEVAVATPAAEVAVATPSTEAPAAEVAVATPSTEAPAAEAPEASAKDAKEEKKEKDEG